MKTTLLTVLISSAFLLGACSDDASAPASHSDADKSHMAEAKETAAAKMASGKEALEEKMDSAKVKADAMMDGTKEKVDAAKVKAEDMVESTKQKAEMRFDDAKAIIGDGTVTKDKMNDKKDALMHKLGQ